MQSYAILAHVQRDKKMEAELQEIRREQDNDLREIELVRQEMESRIDDELNGKPSPRWNEYGRHSDAKSLLAEHQNEHGVKEIDRKSSSDATDRQ